jgi:lipopolysaccharide transport system ATP-binding protein
MSEIAVRASGLYKKFRKGEIYDSLRDLVPALLRRSVHGSDESLGEQEFWALRDVSFEVERGEAFGVIGYNGAGKSTLLKHLCGIMEPTRGTLEVHGRLSALIEVGAGFHEDLTGRENVYLNGAILGMSREEVHRKFDSIVEFAGLEDFIDTPVKRYSSGMYARLGFAVAVHVEPDILVVDEVLSVGDYLFQRKGVEKMRSIMAGGATVIFVSHNFHAVATLCQRAMLMERGRVVAVGPSGDVIRQYLERGAATAEEGENWEVRVSRIEMRGAAPGSLSFESCQRVTVEVGVEARRPCAKLSIEIECLDEESYVVFNTASQRLGAMAFDLAAGESAAAAFELSLNLAPGTYRLGAFLYRSDIQRNYNARLVVTTFYVTSSVDVRGVAHVQPKFLGLEKTSAGRAQ